ncbi:MAG: hypothetical protein SGARI_001661 [Bacillariaceae sp.]
MEWNFRFYNTWEATVKIKAFSYIDAFYGHRLVADDDNDPSEVYEVVPRLYTDRFDFKDSFARVTLGMNFVPRTYFSKEKALEELEGDPTVDLIFIKDRRGTYGQGIEVVSKGNLASTPVPDGHVIQEALTRNLALFDDSKISVRVHFIMMRGKLYCHHRGFVQRHNEPFDPSNPSKSVHVSHANYTTYLLDMRWPTQETPFLDPDRVKQTWKNGIFPLDNVPNGTKWMSTIAALGPELGRVLEPVLQQTLNEPLQYTLWGVDFLPLVNGDLKMLEINSYPSMRRFDVMTDLILQALGLGSMDSDMNERLPEIWDLSSSSRREQHDEM